MAIRNFPLLFIALFLLASVSHAASLSPGTVAAPINKPVYQPKPKQKADISRPEANAPQAPDSGIKVQVNRFDIVGNTTFSDDQLLAVIKRYIGRPLTINEIYQAADLVETYYRYHGYLLTSVYVPAQKINSGVIKLEVIEGRLGSISFEGKLDSYTPGFLRNQVDELKPGQIIDDDSLERETLLLGDLPGLDTRAAIKPGKEYGTSDIVFINEEKRFSGVVGLNNYGRKSIGEYRLEGGLLIANPIMQGDQLNLSAILAQESRMLYGRIDYDALINHRGSRLGVSYSAFNYDVDTAEAGLPANQTLEGSGTTAMLRFSHPLQRSSRNNTNLFVNLRNSKTDESGTLGIRPDTSINLLEVFVGYDHLYHDYAKTTVYGGVVTNFKSRDNLLNTDSQKARLSLDISHYQPFAKTWFVLARAQGVYSPDPLVDLEKFRLGGQGSVRAFPSAEIAGDKGGVLSLDLGLNIIAHDRLVITPKLFADAGRVYRIEPVGLPASESLAGYGAGVSMVYAQTHSLDLEVAKPTTNRDSSDGRDTRFWLSYRGLF